jgi:sulfonate transport system permease protein
VNHSTEAIIIAARRPQRPAVLTTLLAPIKGIRGLLLLIIPLVVWQIFGNLESFSYPPPSSWWGALVALYKDGSLLYALSITSITFALGLGLALMLGVVLGILIGSIRILDQALSPLIDFIRAMPPPAIVPAIGLIAGWGLSSSVAIVVIAVMWPILLNTVIGVRSIPAVRQEMSQTLGLGAVAIMFKVTIPSLAPFIMAGLRISVSMALIVTLFADMLGSGEGIGRLLQEMQHFYRADAVWGLLVLIGALGFLINLLFDLVQHLVFRRWPEDVRPAG